MTVEWPIEMGEGCTPSNDVHTCAHVPRDEISGIFHKRHPFMSQAVIRPLTQRYTADI